MSEAGLEVWDLQLSVPISGDDNRPILRAGKARLSNEMFTLLLREKQLEGRLTDGGAQVTVRLRNLPAFTARLRVSTHPDGLIDVEITDLRLAGLFGFGAAVGWILDRLSDRIEQQPGMFRNGPRLISIDPAKAMGDVPIRWGTRVQQIQVTPDAIAVTCG